MVDNIHIDHQQQIDMDYHEYKVYLNQLMTIDKKSTSKKIQFQIKSGEILPQLNPLFHYLI
jgi:hypothetical protein